MSKQRKTQIKDNTISSKLLGANLSDINIQKFRDSNQNKKQKYEIGGKISLPILKNITNKFSPEVIFTITLPSHAISNLEPLSQCVNLMVVDFSHNSIENITPFKNMKKLRIVNLSQNCINNIDVFQNCNELVNLNLQGNLLKGVDQLRYLKTCVNLKNLHLQSLGGNNQNPICSLNNYRANVFGQMQQIKRLDCIPSNVKEFANGSQIKQNKKKELKIQIKNNGSFYTNKFPAIQPYTPPTFNEEATLKKSINSCKSSIQELQLRMRAMLTI